MVKTIKIDDYHSTAALLKVLAHPTRLGVLYLLENNDSLSVSEMKNILGCEQSYISQHLKQLKLKGILGTRRKGKFVFYFLKEKSSIELTKILDKITF